ncbi:hypothetical protein RhiirA4_492232 [Rhizophagus irregularis]|uniref:Uncharacterized protein n=1 Tax=Rhizophagus irregularis TaxID=588596 RepID=A0A2I1HWY5_9GLOM|nr:hypothetical protein RhiirA4_492232 [Rhizophagus irregularis]
MKEGLLTIELDDEIYEIPIDFKGKKNVKFDESGSESESDEDSENMENVNNDSSEESESENEYEDNEEEELLSAMEEVFRKKKNNEEKFENKVCLGEMSNERKEMFKELIWEYEDIFEYDGEKLGRRN